MQHFELGEDCLSIANPNEKLLAESKSGNSTGVRILLQCNSTDVNTEGYRQYTPLIWASKYGNLKVVQVLLDQNNIDVNKNNYDGWTALCWASYKGHATIVRLLLKKEGIDINKGTNQWQTALYLASKKGNSVVVEILLAEENIDVNKEDKDGITALNLATSKGHSDTVELLLDDKDIDINRGDEYGNTPLCLASQKGYSEIVELLLNNEDTDINRGNDFGETALQLASRNGYEEIVKLLLPRPGIDINRQNKDVSALWMASKNNHTDVMQLFLEHPNTNLSIGVSTEDAHVQISKLISNEETENQEETHNILMAALLGNNTEVRNLLQGNENKLNSFDNFQRTPLFWASTRGHNDIVKLLISQPHILVNVGRSTDNANPLYQASKYGLMDTVNILLEHPMIDVNHATLGKKTSLMVASIYGYRQVVQKLLSITSIDVNYATFDGKTALIYAVLAKQRKILELLLRCPKTITNLQDEEYMTALDRAKKMSYTELIALFTARGTLQMTKGHTCCSNTINRGLHVAVQYNHLPWIQTFLVCPGIEINVHNKNGYTPLSLATERGYAKIVEIFLADQRIDVNKQNTESKQNALLIASKRGHVDILKQLILHNQTLVNQQNAKGESALSTALEEYSERPYPHEYLQIIKLLMRCPKTEVKIEGSYGPEIMQYIAIRSSFLETNPTCCLKVNESLLGAAWAGDYRAIRGLLHCPGSSVNTNDKKGRTPVYIAAMMGHLLTLEVLLQNYDINANIGREIDGGTAFSVASERSHFNVLRALIENGKSDESKGWCSDQWANPCTVSEEDNEETKIPTTILPTSGEVN